MAGPEILVVEDDREFRDAVAYMLRTEGFEPVCITDGEAALDYLRRSVPPCLILLDITMPRMDGVRLRRELLNDPELRAVPVVLLSSERETPLMARRLALPYLKKPLEAGTLLEAVRRYAATERGS